MQSKKKNMCRNKFPQRKKFYYGIVFWILHMHVYNCISIYVHIIYYILFFHVLCMINSYYHTCLLYKQAFSFFLSLSFLSQPAMQWKHGGHTKDTIVSLMTWQCYTTLYKNIIMYLFPVRNCFKKLHAKILHKTVS